MRERAMRIGGILKISSSADAGTEAQLSIPSALAFKVVALNPREQFTNPSDTARYPAALSRKA
jgi:hypothetical protein